MKTLKIKYLYINSYVYIKCSFNKCLIFNPENAKYIFVEDTYKVNILKRLYDYSNNNFYSTKLSAEEFVRISDLGEKLSKFSIGGILERDEEDNQLVIVPPVIRVSHQLDNYSNDSFEYLQDIKSYIHNLHIYLNSGTGSFRKKYFDSYKQFESPKYSQRKKSLDFISLKKNIENIDYPPEKIILSGGNIFQYKNLTELCFYIFNNFKETIVIFTCDIFDFIDNQSFFNNILEYKYYVKIIIDSSLIKEDYIIKLKDIEKISLNFIITNNEELELVNSITEKYKINNFILLPYFNGKNIDFFKLNVFLEKEDLLVKQEMFEIASKEIINKQLFGNIYIFENGDISLNQNVKPITNINKNNLYFSLYKSFANKKHYPWFLTRENVSPCKNCIYSKLCPPISNYELFLNKFNFCKINNDE